MAVTLRALNSHFPTNILIIADLNYGDSLIKKGEKSAEKAKDAGKGKF